MSAIDTVAHQLCGTLAGLPVYHLSGPIPDGVLDVPAGPSDLLVGGGSGEHPVAVFDIVSAVVSVLLDDELELTHDDGLPRLHEWPYSRIELVIDSLMPLCKEPQEAVRFTWGGDDWVRFAAAAGALRGYSRPYAPETDASIELWMQASLGEYALVALNEHVQSLLPTGERTLAREIAGLGRALGDRPLYLNVLTFPTGYERLGGRRETLGDGNVRH